MVDIDTQEKTIKHPGGRPICAPWRFDNAGNLVIKNPTRQDYNINNYKLRTASKSICELCNREVIWKHLRRHQETSKICKRIRESSSEAANNSGSD